VRRLPISLVVARRGRRRLATAFAAVAALHGLAIFLVMREENTARAVFAEAPPVDVTLVRPFPAPRPKRSSLHLHPSQRNRSAAEANAQPTGPPAVVDQTPSPPPAPPIEKRWKVAEAVIRQEIVREAIRRKNPCRVCFGEEEGSLSTEEKEMCLRYWSSQRRCAEP
jgi:hypothetical protein